MNTLDRPLMDFLALLTRGSVAEAPADESWSDHVHRISEPGRVHAITEEAFDYWLDVLPPRWLHGSCFCQTEGEEAFRLFWRRDRRYFARQLTNAETLRFCRLAGVRPPCIV